VDVRRKRASAPATPADGDRVKARSLPRHAARGAVELQRQLRDLLCLAVVGDHVRWVLVDDEGELAEWLADAVPEWRALADQVAKQLVALGVPPDGRLRSLAEDIAFNWVPDGWLHREEAERLLAGRMHMLASWARLRSQATDRGTAHLLESVAAGLDSTPRHGSSRSSR
jgi:DNA-binding ferritin-like protein